MSISGMSVSILGLGASGVAAARLALHEGANVYVSDLRTEASTPAGAAELASAGADVELGRHDLERIAASRLVVASPGIPPDAPVLRSLRERGVRWISEPDFAVRFFPGALIAVTGTNGKTTTAVWTAHLLEEAGVSVALGGNVGGGLAPAASTLALTARDADWWVLEMSSFQLADVEVFSPEIGVLTGLAPDHLDRYPDLASYYGDKARMYGNARPSDRWVLPADDEVALALPGDAPGARYLFGGKAEDVAGAPSASTTDEVPAASHDRAGWAALRDGVLALDVGEGEELLAPRSAVPVLGEHNLGNALAAVLAARLTGTPSAALRAGLESLRSLPHRMEPVARRAGVVFVNDSKATNVSAAGAAFRTFEGPFVALLGGKDKGEDFRPLAEALLAGNARAAVLYGAAGARLEEELAPALAGALPLERTEGFDEAVAVAARRSRPGFAVLLSPACSSFDLFENYEARGRRFGELAARVDLPFAEGTD